MKRKRNTKIKYFKNLKIKKFLINILYVLIIIGILYNTFFFTSTTITRKSYIDFFGISLFSVNNKLMEKDLKKNDLFISKRSNSFEKDDIIVYEVNNSIRINKIYDIQYDKNTGEKQYVTKSNANYQPDIEKISDSQIIGKKICSIWGLGILLKILQGKFTTILVLSILILVYFYNKYMYQKQKVRNRKKKKIYQTQY